MDSKSIINKKIKNKKLSYEEIEFMVNNYVGGSISKKDMTIFLKAIYSNGLTFDETYYLTDTMIKSGSVLDLSNINKITVDKHSTGGVGDKTSLIILPICAALGLAVPKMSGRSLGNTGGTVDKLESIPGFKSELTEKKFIEIINEVGCADICQNEKIAIADKKIYDLRDKTGLVDSIPLIASSIMSKKIACSSKNIVIDLKVGNGAFMKSIGLANRLARLMIKIGKKYNRNVVCVLTDMSFPLGNNIGNSLEIKEVISFFEGKEDKNLREIVVSLSAHMVALAKNTPYKQARKLVTEVIDNQEAKRKFYEWIEAQGGKISKLRIEANRIDVKSLSSGYVKEISARVIGKLSSELARSEAGKTNSSAGIVLRKKIGDFVERDEILCSLYYNNEVNNMISRALSAYKLEKQKPKEKSIILKVVR